MRSIRLFLIVFPVLFVLEGNSQSRQIAQNSVVWGQFTQKIKFTERLGGSFTTQYRGFTSVDKVYHLFFSIGLTRDLGHGFSMGVGFTSLNINQFVDTDYVVVPELRPYQAIQYGTSIFRSKFSWRLMVEERFFRNARDGELANGFDPNLRFRNKVAYTQFLSEQLDLILSSEIMFNAGGIDVNIFDQHRTQIMFGTAFGKLSTNFGYMHWFVQTPNNQHDNRHTLVIAFTHSI